MRLETLPSEFQEALPVLEKIKAAGFEAYFVGGSVRDALLQRPIHDVDIASSSYPEETKRIFDRTVDVGIEHGTVLVLENRREYEVTTFRTEDVYVDYRRPSKVSFVRSLEEDLKRRDFTINALALDENGHVIDLFQGLDDLKNRILRAVALDFDLEQDTFVAMKDCAPLLEKISVERIFIEFDKLLLAPFWRKGLEALLTSGAIEFLPDLKESRAKLERLFELDSEFRFSASEQAWAALLLALDVQNVKGFLKKWKTSREFAKKVEDLVEIAAIRSERDLTKRDCYDYDIDLLQQAEELRKAQGLPVNFSAIQNLDASLTIHNKQEMVVNGGMLMREFSFEPGPKLGQILKELEYAIVDGHLPNDLEAIYAYTKERK